MPADFSGIHMLYSAETLEVLLNKITTALASMKNTPLVTLKQKTAKVGFAVSAIASSCCVPHTSGPCLRYRMRRRWDGVVVKLRTPTWLEVASFLALPRYQP